MSQLIISLLVTLHVSAMKKSAMQVKEDPSVPNSKVFCLANMHIDIHNNIAQILMCDDESEEEFIARTKIEKEVPEQCYSFLGEFPMISKYRDTISVFSSDEMKIAAFSMIRGSSLWEIKEINKIIPALMIIDLQKKNNNENIVYEGELKQSNYRCIALSRSGSMIAMFRFELVFVEDDIKKFLEVQKIDLKIDRQQRGRIEMLQKRELPCVNWFPEVLAFNKQGTLLIAHGKNGLTEKDVHKIFSLKSVDSTKPQVVVDEKNKLQNYFRDKRVCNKFIKDVQ